MTGLTIETRSPGPQNFVLVHGGWHSSKHWHKVSDTLTRNGHHVVAVDLPDRGGSIQHPELEDYCATVADTLLRQAHRGRATLVGHSIGGVTITRVGEAMPDILRRLVYLTAYVPVRMPSALEYRNLPERDAAMADGLLIGDPATTGAFRIDPRPDDPAYLEKLHQAYYHDVPVDEFLTFAKFLKSDLPTKIATADGRGTPERWGSVPRTFIRCSEDRAIPITLQDRMIAEADHSTPGNIFDIRTLPASHSPFASMPRELAAILANLDT